MVEFANAIFAILISLVFGVVLRDILSSSVQRPRQIQRPKLCATWWSPIGSLRPFAVLKLVASLQPLHLRILSSLRMMRIRMNLTINWFLTSIQDLIFYKCLHWPFLSPASAWPCLSISRIWLLTSIYKAFFKTSIYGTFFDEYHQVCQTFSLTSASTTLSTKCLHDLFFHRSAWPCLSISRSWRSLLG